MKSKKPSLKSPSRRASLGTRLPRANGRAVVLDFYTGWIEAFNRSQGGGIAVRKDRTGYTLLRDDTARPVARLRPLGSKGMFEIFSWHSTAARWRKIGTFGGVILPLDEALEFIADDPMGCFWC
jgi:hypothetical protein